MFSLMHCKSSLSWIVIVGYCGYCRIDEFDYRYQQVSAIFCCIGNGSTADTSIKILPKEIFGKRHSKHEKLNFQVFQWLCTIFNDSYILYRLIFFLFKPKILRWIHTSQSPGPDADASWVQSLASNWWAIGPLDIHNNWPLNFIVKKCINRARLVVAIDVFFIFHSWLNILLSELS